MVTYYTSQSITGFNTNPPPDDGSQVAANEILWATILSKIGTPLKNRQDAIDAELANLSARMLFNGSVSKTVAYTVLVADLGKVILASNGITVTLPVAADAGDGFVVTVKNTGTSNVTVDGDSAETIDGSLTKTIKPLQSATFRCTGSAWNTISSGASLPPNHLSELAVTAGTDTDHDIDVAAGAVRSAGDTADIVLSAITKQIDATWAAGTNAGGLSSSLVAPANDTWYYIHAIIVGGAADVGFDTSATASNLITDHSATAYAPLWLALTDGSANITALVPAVNTGKPVSGAEITTTSGTSHTFYIPPWAKRIIIQFNDVQTSGASRKEIRIGDSGGVETTGYAGATANTPNGSSPVTASVTDSFGVGATSASTHVLVGSVTLTLEDPANFTWVAQGVTALSESGIVFTTAGRKSLSAALDRIQITTANGTDTFTAGNINILYD